MGPLENKMHEKLRVLELRNGSRNCRPPRLRGENH